MKEKQLITSFFVANLIDTLASTYFLAQDGWRELNRLAFDKIAMGEIHELIIIKLTVTAVLIGAYALAKATDSRLEYPLEISLRLGSLVVWSVQIWNAANILAAFAVALV